MKHPLSRLTKRSTLAITAAAVVALSGCANMKPVIPPKDVSPAHWSAPLPATDRTAELEHWWESQGEPELASLIEDAQRVSPSIAAAQARIEQAKAQQAQALSSLLPQLSANASASKTKSALYSPTLTQAQAGVQMNWELSLASLRGADRIDARAQLDSAQAKWHDTRILVAAEVAGLYHEARARKQQLSLLEADAASRSESERLTRLSYEAGMSASPALATARANAADVRAHLRQQQAACEIDIKGLVAMTGRNEADLKATLAPALVREGTPTPFAISAIPAQTLAQRPDVLVAERDVLQAQARLMQAESERLPRLSLEGFIGQGHYVMSGLNKSEPTWTFGPLAVSVPLFDAGKRAAQQHAAEADLHAYVVAYQAGVRQAVREVEEALVQLDAAEQRWQESRISADQAHTILAAHQRLLQQGMVSQLDLEDIQRQARAADLSAIALDLERQRAWITLYRAVGGGFKPLNSEA